mmetsp:Transcript_66974/g.131871  ORF Transcript_66974/g.131871 Transcript_66974/m.131871 type:complete len:246 (+) Transcript_66974:120-857(+)
MQVEVLGAAHCSVADCHQLDFLPFKCDACAGVFCKDHFAHARHRCPKASSSNVQVLVCPLCAAAVRMSISEDPNVTWERHYLNGCTQVKPASKGPNTCPIQGCREKLGPSNRFECTKCGITVCIKHRAEEDHPCVARPAPRGAGPFLVAGSSSSTQGRGRSTPAWQGRGNAVAAAGFSAAQLARDEQMARELQQRELAAATAVGQRGVSSSAGRPGQKKKISQRVMSMFACFKTSQSRRGLLDRR